MYINKIEKNGFSILSFMMYITIITISIGLVVPLIFHLYKNALTSIDSMHNDFIHEYAREIMQSDIICAPHEIVAWKFSHDFISIKSPEKKIVWQYKNTNLYRIEKTTSIEKKLFLQNIPDICFTVIKDEKSIHKIVYTIKEGGKNKPHSYQFLLRSGLTV